MTQEDVKAAEKRRLAEALRANLRRRKAAVVKRPLREMDESGEAPEPSRAPDESQRG